MEMNTRLSILPFPQSFDGATLALNIVVLPRNQNPLQPAIEQHATIPDSPAFADAVLTFDARIVSGLSGFPNNHSANAVVPKAGSEAYDVSKAQVKEAVVQNVFRYAHVYPRAVAMLASGKIDVKPLITDRFAFAESVEAFDFAKKMPPASVKVQIEMPRV